MIRDPEGAVWFETGEEKGGLVVSGICGQNWADGHILAQLF